MSGGDTSSEGKEKLDKGTEYNGHSYTWGSQGRPLEEDSGVVREDLLEEMV